MIPSISKGPKMQEVHKSTLTSTRSNLLTALLLHIGRLDMGKRKLLASHLLQGLHNRILRRLELHHLDELVLRLLLVLQDRGHRLPNERQRAS